MCWLCERALNGEGNAVDHGGFSADFIGPDAAGTTVSNYTALLSGYAWNTKANVLAEPAKATFVTFSFPTSFAAHGAAQYSNAASSWSGFTEAEKDVARAALKQWSDASGIKFLEVDNQKGDILFNWVDFNKISGYSQYAGFAYYPVGYDPYGANLSTMYSKTSGDVYMNGAIRSQMNSQSNYLMNVLLHEIGHAIGMKHSFATTAVNAAVLATNLDNKINTIMSYTGTGAGVLGYLDKEAAAKLYGSAGAVPAGVTFTFNAATDTLTQTGNTADNIIQGISTADIINAGAGNDTLTGMAGADTLNGGLGTDSLYGGEDDDILNPGDGSGFVDGGDGTDTLDFTGLATALSTNQFNRVLFGAFTVEYRNIEKIVGGSGNDTLTLYNLGNATLVGGAGNDTLGAGTTSATRTFDGGVGTDTVSYSEATSGVTVSLAVATAQTTGFGSHTLTGIENLTGSAFVDRLTGNASANVLDGGLGNDTLTGLAGDDTYLVNAAADRVIEAANGGTDKLIASASYVLAAGQSIERMETSAPTATTAIDLTGNALVQIIVGNAGANRINGGGGGDRMFGKAGNDTYYVRHAADKIYESTGEGFDRVYCAVTFAAASGQSIELIDAAIASAASAIDLKGNELAQTIVGNGGFNKINGLAGNDVLTGGAGIDRFYFTSALGATNIDRITDMVSATDDIVLDNAVFTGLTTGALAATAFVNGANAVDADDRIIYDQATGKLYFDADGNGAGAKVQFAQLTAGQALLVSDFLVV